MASVRSLETDPLGENADDTRERLQKWIDAVPDIRFEGCPELLAGTLGRDYPYAREIGSQVLLSGAVLTIERPGEARDAAAVYVAGVEGALRVYEVLLASRTDARAPALDALLDERRRGQLRDHVARLAQEHCKKSNVRFVAAPLGAAAGLLMSLLVARWLGRPWWDTAMSPTVVLRIVLVCAAYYLAALAALHVLESDYDPRFFPVSHYAWGAYGPLMTTTFFVLGLALFAVVRGLGNANAPPRSTRIGIALLLVGAVFVCFAGVFRAFPLHDVASAVALPSIAMGVLVLSRSFGVGALLMAVGMLAALVSIVLDVGMPGLQQRAFLVLLLAWLVTVAYRMTRPRP